MREPLLEAAADCFITLDQVSRLEQQVEKVELATAGLQLLVAFDGGGQLLL